MPFLAGDFSCLSTPRLLEPAEDDSHILRVVEPRVSAGAGIIGLSARALALLGFEELGEGAFDDFVDTLAMLLGVSFSLMIGFGADGDGVHNKNEK